MPENALEIQKEPLKAADSASQEKQNADHEKAERKGEKKKQFANFEGKKANNSTKKCTRARIHPMR